MRIPSISRYIESIENPYGLLRSLGEFTVTKDAYGETELHVGNNAVIFPIMSEGRKRLFRCFTRHTVQSRAIYSFLQTLNLPFLPSIRLLEDEIYVYDHDNTGRYYDVVYGDWVDGSSLEQEVRRAANKRDKKRLTDLSETFDRLAGDLLLQPWAHGDLKPENIIVTPDGRMILIDFDAMYVPGLSHSGEIGTETYQHPLRDVTMYDKHIDDYSIAIISSSLKVLAQEPGLWQIFNRSDNLIFEPKEILTGKSRAYSIALDIASRQGMPVLYRMLKSLESATPYLYKLGDMLLCPHTTAQNVPVPFEKDGLWGFRHDGQEVIAPLFRSVSSFREGLAAVRLGDYNHFIDIAGNIVINASDYAETGSFNEGVAPVLIDGMWGYIDKQGEMVIEPRFDMAGTMREGMAVIRTGGKYGFINSLGEIAINPEFDYASGFRNSAATVEVNKDTFRLYQTGEKILISD